MRISCGTDWIMVAHRENMVNLLDWAIGHSNALSGACLGLLGLSNNPLLICGLRA